MSPHTHAPPNLPLDLFTKKRRVNIACVHCRKRKVKCTTFDESSCGRCSKMGLSCTYLPVGAQGVDLKSPTAAVKYSDRRRVSTPPPATPRPWSQLHLQKIHEHHNSMNPTFEKRPLPTKEGPHTSGGIRLLPLPFEDDILDERSTFERIASWPFHIPLEPAAPPIAFHQTPLHGQEYDSDYRRYFPELAVKHPRVPYSPSSPDVYLGPCMCPPTRCRCDRWRRETLSDSEPEVNWSPGIHFPEPT
ncbi:hypothetical protein B0H14DRAFT_1291747 [Mycena olivaceomarginata]|nr:hypothetical protein B0H14DRAFT_1291747 [Mycena olivaceomarginata]